MIQRRQFAAALGAAVFAPQLRAAEPGVTDSEILFGHTGILNGPLGGQIKVMLAGAELAFAESRAQGGAAGRRVRVDHHAAATRIGWKKRRPNRF